MKTAQETGVLIRPKGREMSAIKWDDNGRRFIRIGYSSLSGELQQATFGPESGSSESFLGADDLFTIWEITSLKKMKKEWRANNLLLGCI